MERFGALLRRRDLTVTIRTSRGQDIWGACGQLGSKHPAAQSRK
jgi:adenine C2-methylase RlmN of 23S rRNA A2503 and tRNA A37